ncbi:hypothetical protein KSP39_PZI018603 [Platanthera zijinensis]|uniref:Eukaryotic translation initiation factor 2 subunit beta n=1 Tax=Platanthera zijinensis TaxID=2320716 RepID=A0AAP0B2Y1_9ASPA
MADENPSDLNEEIPELVPFDSSKKKKKKKVVIEEDPWEVVDKLAEKTENLSVADTPEPHFTCMKKKEKKPVESDFLVDDKENFEDVDDSEDYKYEELLDRVFNTLRENNPDLAGDRRRTVMRPPQVLREGTKKTIFANFMDLCKTMHRQPEHVMMFLLAEMGTSGSLDGQQRLVVKGRFAPKNFEGIVRRYVSKFTTSFQMLLH